MEVAGMKRDFAGMEKRRLRAADLFAAGVPQVVVARKLGVSKQSAHRWHKAWTDGGTQALKAAGRAGRRPRLSADQMRELEGILLAGPGESGYRTELWTLPRIAEVIRRRFAVSYHPGYVWCLLRELGWSCQKPASRARERDEERIQRWLKETWPAIKRGRKRAAPR
jgi:transposase